ncbi:MAG: hypothetical protein AAGD33_03260 [Actinomycetota bacterium]
MTDRDPLDRLSRVANQPERPSAVFRDRLLDDLLGDLIAGDPAPIDPTVDPDTFPSDDSNQEIIMLAPNRDEPHARSRTWMFVAAAVAALVLIGGLIVAGTRGDDGPVVDEPLPEVEEDSRSLVPDPRSPAEIEADTALAQAALVTAEEIGGSWSEAPAADNPDAVALRRALLDCFGAREGGAFGPAQASTGEFNPRVNAFNEHLAQTVGVLPDVEAASALIAGASEPVAAGCLIEAYTDGIAGSVAARRNGAEVVVTGDATIEALSSTELDDMGLGGAEAAAVRIRIPVEVVARSRGNAVAELVLIRVDRAITALEWGGDDGRGVSWDVDLAVSKLEALLATEVEGVQQELEGAPQGVVGDASTPVPAGEIADIGEGYRLQVLSITGDATDDVLATDEFNNPPPEGSRYTLISLAGGYFGTDDPTETFVAVIRAFGADGVELDRNCGQIPQIDRSTVNLFGGGVIQGDICVVTTPADEAELVLRASGDSGTDHSFLDASSSPTALDVMQSLDGVQTATTSAEARRDPTPIGVSATVDNGNWDVMVTGPAVDLTDVLATDPPDGSRLIGVPVRMENQGVDGAAPFVVNARAVGSSNVQYSSDCGDGVPNALDMSSPVPIGDLIEGQLCFVVPTTEVDSVTVYTGRTVADAFFATS